MSNRRWGGIEDGVRLGHFAQIAWIQQIMHTSRTPAPILHYSVILQPIRALCILYAYALSPLNVKLMLCEFVIASNANSRFQREHVWAFQGIYFEKSTNLFLLFLYQKFYLSLVLTERLKKRITLRKSKNKLKE